METLERSPGGRQTKKPVASALAAARPRIRGLPLPLVGAIALTLGSVGLFLLSRGKWSDAIIDSGREWIVPDALARGGLLYRDVVYWFGPFTPYFHAAFFRLFGSSYATLVAAGIAGSLGVLGALSFALRRVTGRRETALWTSLAIPALIFMPNAGGPILGMGYRIWHAAALSVAAVALAARPGEDRRPMFRAIGVGSLCALAALCRTEWGLVAGAASFLAFLLRERSARARLSGALAAGGAFLVLLGGTLAAFVAAAGPKAVLEDGHILLTGLPPETRAFLVQYSGIHDWPSGVLELLYSAATWGGALLLLQILAIGRGDRSRVLRKLPMLAPVFLVVICAALLGAGGFVLFSAAPLVCAAAAVLGLARRTRSSAGLFGFGIAGVLSSYRRPFHIGDAAYVGPPLLFALICAAGLVQRLIDRERDSGTQLRFRMLSSVAVLLLVVFAFGGRVLHYADDERISIPGTQGMLSARPELVARFETLVRMIRRESATAEGLVVFPEGEILNYLSNRPNPIRHKLYIPGYLTDRNEHDVVAELEQSRPRLIVLLHRPTGEYGPGTFGVSYGRRIWQWIQQHYSFQPVDSGEPVLTRMGARAVLAVRRD
jgi:hypothetical protein